jgi:hypothetical protein
MTTVSYYEQSLPRLRAEGTPVLQIFVGVLASLYAFMTVQMAGFVAVVGLSTNHAFTSDGQVYDAVGRRITGWSAMWQQYGALGWALFAVALLIGVAWTWRAIGRRRTPTAWFLLAGVGALASMFWLLNAARFHL